MKIRKLADVPTVETPGYKAVVKQVVLGPEEGSEEIVLRYFTVQPGGATPYHEHDFPHLVKIEVGQGVAVDADKNEAPVVAGDYVYVHDNEIHNFKNTGDGTFEFVCLVPMRGELSSMSCEMPPAEEE